jgi:2-methylcitrate dehydratase PrpD
MTTVIQKAPLLAEIAKFIVTVNGIDSATLHQAKRVVADTIGVAFSGVKTDAFQMAQKSDEQLFGEGDYKIWNTDQASTLLGATFYNALSVSSTDFDEGHRKAVGHPASLIVPVAMALGKYQKKSFDEILKAVVIGYEIGTRFSHSRIAEKISTYSTGRWGAIASAATAAFLLELSVEKTMHALSLASVLSPAMLGGSTDVSTGSMSKEGVAWAAQSGLQSALLAKNGFIGIYLFLDEHDDYNQKT